MALLLCGQVSAQSIPDCEEMVSNSLHDSHEMHDMEHMQHAGKMDTAQSDCCGNDCRCPQGALSSLALLNGKDSLPVERVNSGITHSKFVAVIAPQSNRFIPPISA